MIIEQFNLQSLLRGTSAWTADAACAGQYELYDTAAALSLDDFASKYRRDLRDKAVDVARHVCRTCPVLHRCETASMTEDRGFWAGMTEAQRDARFYPNGRPEQPLQDDTLESA